jgi:hypothetical protein
MREGRAIAKRRGNSAAFWKGEFKNSLFWFIYFKTDSWTDAQRLFKSFLARNELVASSCV